MNAWDRNTSELLSTRPKVRDLIATYRRLDGRNILEFSEMEAWPPRILK